MTLIYKEYDNNALPAGSEGDADEASDAPPGIFGDWREQIATRGVVKREAEEDWSKRR